MVRRKYLWLIIVGIGLIGLIIGSFVDLELSKAVFSKNNPFGLAMSAFGELPAYGGSAFFAGIMLIGALKKYKDNKKGKYTFIFLFVLSFLIYIYFMGNAVTNCNGYGSINESLKGNYLFIFLFGFLLIAPCAALGVFAGRKIKNSEDLVYIILFSILMVGVICIGINVIKPLMHRPRFRWMYETGNYFSEFKNWWQPLGSKYDEYLEIAKNMGMNKDEFKSFPSGHVTAAMGGFILVTVLPYIFDKTRKHEWLWLTIGFVYVILIAYTRIFMGAHFLSDVSMGLIVGGIGGLVNSYIVTYLLEKQSISGQQ